MQDNRRQKYGKNAGGNAINLSNNPLLITSPLNKSKQDVFSQTGKLNLQGDGAMADET